MAKLSDLRRSTQRMITSLFTLNNYCFATCTDNRTPTFYFAQGGLARLQQGHPNGRLRTMHAYGPLIEKGKSRKSHWFFTDQAELDAAYDELGGFTKSRALKDYAKGMRTQPQNGDLHLEFKHNRKGRRIVSSRHNSAGLVDLSPINNAEKITKIVDYILECDHQIEINGAYVRTPGGPRRTPNSAGFNLAGFLARL